MLISYILVVNKMKVHGLNGFVKCKLCVKSI